jgi:hypothetical protein
VDSSGADFKKETSREFSTVEELFSPETFDEFKI